MCCWPLSQLTPKRRYVPFDRALVPMAGLPGLYVDGSDAHARTHAQTHTHTCTRARTHTSSRPPIHALPHSPSRPLTHPLSAFFLSPPTHLPTHPSTLTHTP